jgi:Domain of unknown function (DUF1906)
MCESRRSGSNSWRYGPCIRPEDISSASNPKRRGQPVRAALLPRGIRCLLAALSTLCGAVLCSPAPAARQPHAQAPVTSMHRPHSWSSSRASAPGSYLGFDRNNFPGAAALPALRKTFSFTGYWLNTPPSARSNTWTGKRRILRQYGFGFQVLFNGRRYGELQDGDPQSLGKSDARTAVAAVRREGFPYGTIIFIDQEEGGRLLAAQKAYIFAWAAAVNASGYRAGIYCSAMPATEQSGAQVVTAKDLYDNGGRYQLTFWVYNTASPPSPGCTFPHTHVPPSASGIPFASVWQFGQSPRPKDFAGQRGYAPDGQCYAPGLPRSQRIYIDVDSADSPDPSNGRGPATHSSAPHGSFPR